MNYIWLFSCPWSKSYWYTFVLVYPIPANLWRENPDMIPSKNCILTQSNRILSYTDLVPILFFGLVFVEVPRLRLIGFWPNNNQISCFKYNAEIMNWSLTTFPLLYSMSWVGLGIWSVELFDNMWFFLLEVSYVYHLWFHRFYHSVLSFVV